MYAATRIEHAKLDQCRVAMKSIIAVVGEGECCAFPNLCVLKRGINGTYVSIELFHLFRCLDEQVFRYNNRKLTDGERFEIAVRGMVGKRLTYAEVTGKVEETVN